MFKNNLKKTYIGQLIIEWDKINTKRYGDFIVVQEK